MTTISRRLATLHPTKTLPRFRGDPAGGVARVLSTPRSLRRCQTDGWLAATQPTDGMEY